MCLVSIIIPSFNVEQYIGQCLDSIIVQKNNNIEIICVDDNSTDNTVNIIKKYASQYDFIKVVENKTKTTGGNCRNIGLNLAQGEFIYFCDSDDYVKPNLFQQCISRIKSTNADICIFNVECTYMEQRIQTTGPQCRDNPDVNFAKTHQFFNKFSIDNVFNVTHATVWDKLYRLDFIRKHNIVFSDLENTNDAAFYYKTMYLADRITYLDEILYVHRIAVQTSVQRNKIKSYANFSCIFKSNAEIFDFLNQQKEHELSQKFKEFRFNGSLNWLFNSTLWLLNPKYLYDIAKLLKHQIAKYKINVLHDNIKQFISEYEIYDISTNYSNIKYIIVVPIYSQIDFNHAKEYILNTVDYFKEYNCSICLVQMTNTFDDAIMIDKDELKSYICSSMTKYDQTIVIKINPMDILSKITPIIIRNSLYHDNETTVLKNSYYVEYDENDDNLYLTANADKKIPLIFSFSKKSKYIDILQNIKDIQKKTRFIRDIKDHKMTLRNSTKHKYNAKILSNIVKVNEILCLFPTKNSK